MICKGYKVLQYSDYEAAGTRKGLICKALGMKTGRAFFWHTILLVIKNGLFLKADVFKRMVSCLSFLGYYNYYEKDCDYLVMDEGIIQGMVSAFYIYNKQAINFKRILSDLLKWDLLFVYIDTEPSVASERISQRKTYGHGRCDDIADMEERKRVLAHQKENFDSVYGLIQKMFCSLKISNKEEVLKSVEEVVGVLC